MLRRFSWLIVLLIACMTFWFAAPAPAQAAELVHPITLYQESVKVENMIKQGEAAGKVLQELDILGDMYTRLDPSLVHQHVEGVQAVSDEIIALKTLFAAVKGPDQAVAEYRMHRLTVAFDSLAYPASPAWLPIARSMENQVDKLIDAVAKQDQKSAKALFSQLESERESIGLALQLHGSPSELNVQLSAQRFVEQQLAGEQVTDKQGTLDALGMYKASLGRVTNGMQVVEQPPLLPVLHLSLTPWQYGTACGVVLLYAGYRMRRRKKN